MPEATAELPGEWHNLTFSIRRSIRYHLRRERFFELWRRLTSASMLVLGSATFVTLVGSTSSDANPGVIKWLFPSFALFVTILASLDLVVGFSRRSWDHRSFTKQYFRIEQDLVTNKPNEKLLKELLRQRLEIEKDEPPVLHVLNLICHNEVCKALGYGHDEFYEIGIFRRITAPFFDIAPESIQRYSPSKES